MHSVTLTGTFQRERAKRIVDQCPEGWVCNVTPPNRTNDQSRKMWAMLTDLSVAKPEGRRLIPDDWKVIMMHACGWECQFLEGLDGRPFPKGFSSSKLSKAQMADLINFIQAYGDEHGVRWSDDQEKAA